MIFSSSFSLCLRKAFNLSLETEGKDSQGSLKSNTGIHSVSMAWDLARQRGLTGEDLKAMLNLIMEDEL